LSKRQGLESEDLGLEPKIKGTKASKKKATGPPLLQNGNEQENPQKVGRKSRWVVKDKQVSSKFSIAKRKESDSNAKKKIIMKRKQKVDVIDTGKRTSKRQSRLRWVNQGDHSKRLEKTRTEGA